MGQEGCDKCTDHPCCDKCWEDVSEGNQTPLRETEGDLYVCCFCGEETRSGIWARFGSWIIPVECTGHEREYKKETEVDKTEASE